MRCLADSRSYVISHDSDIDDDDNYDYVVVWQDGYSSLMWAASNGHTEVVRLLLAAGADVNGADDVSDNH
jgi:ankyrin repeat protein